MHDAYGCALLLFQRGVFAFCKQVEWMGKDGEWKRQQERMREREFVEMLNLNSDRKTM